jgi:tetratricopeptide (TPR) repeat protein
MRIWRSSRRRIQRGIVKYRLPLARVALVVLAACAAPVWAQLYADLEFCAGSEGTREQRIAACTRAINSGKVATSDLAITYYNRGLEYDGAIADYTQAIRLNPKYVHAYNNRGSALNTRREYDRALNDLNEAIRLDPKYAMAYANRGIVWENKREFDRALADYTESIRLEPRRAQTYADRGDAYAAKGDYKRALADYDMAIKIDPQSEIAIKRRAAALEKMKQRR